MKGNVSKARVVYAKIESEAIQKIANAITKAFIDAGWFVFLFVSKRNNTFAKKYYSSDLKTEIVHFLFKA